MNQLTYSELINRIRLAKGTLIVGIEAETDARARKTGNPHGKITKTVKGVGFVGVDYSKAVEREQIRQGVDPGKNEFEASPRQWGKWLIGGKVAEHNGKYYLRTISTPGLRDKQRMKVDGYRGENGQKLAYDDVKAFLPDKSVSRKQAEKGLIDNERQIDVREFGFDGIRMIRLAGKRYKLVAD